MTKINRLRSITRWLVIVSLTAITVNGWRVVFKVSRGRDLGGATSMYDLWNSTDVVNDNPAGFHQTNLTYMSPFQLTYKSDIVNQWHNHDIKYVKLGVYTGGREGTYVVFNAAGTNKTSWFTNKLAIQSPYTDLSSSGSNQFSLEGSHVNGRFHALRGNTDICNGFGWFAVVDRDINYFCGNRTTDVPYFVYSSNSISTKLTAGTIGDSLAIFVDDCVVNPCEHHGTCTSRVDGYSCQCADQVFGHSCQHECPCEKRGKCFAVNSSHINNAGNVFINGELINEQAFSLDPTTTIACKCPQYYHGAKCQQTTLQCASSPCKNYGSCEEGYTDFTCRCGEDYTGKTCEVVRPPPKKSGLNTGAKVALGICLPLLAVVIFAIIYIVYMFKNPEAHGHEATVKQYTVAREFVRRSIRRVSGRRTKQKDETTDTVAFSPKEKEISEGQINLAFDEGVKAGYARQNSEYYDLSATDNAVVSGQTKQYPTYGQSKQSHGQTRSQAEETRTPTKSESNDAFYKEYRPAQLQGSDNYTHPGHRYDEYNRIDNNVQDPVPQPRTQRQTGRRGRQEPKNTECSTDRDQHVPPPSTEQLGSYLPAYQHQNKRRGEGYDGQILSPNNLRLSNDRYDSDPRSPSRPYDNSRLSPGYRINEKVPDTQSDDRRQYKQHVPDQSHDAPRHLPGSRYNSESHGRAYNDQRRSPDDRYSNQGQDSSYKDDRSPSYNEVSTPRNYKNDQYSRDYDNYNQRSPRQAYNNRHDRYDEYEPRNDYQVDHRSDDRIVFNSSESIEDVTV